MTDPRAALAEALGEVIAARMSRDLAWSQDDGQTIRLDPEQAGWHLGHLVHGPLAERGVLLVTEERLAATVAKIAPELWEKRWGPVKGDPASITFFGAFADEFAAAFFAALSGEVTE